MNINTKLYYNIQSDIIKKCLVKTTQGVVSTVSVGYDTFEAMYMQILFMYYGMS